MFSCLLDSDNRPGKKEQPSMCLVQGLEKILLSLKKCNNNKFILVFPLYMVLPNIKEIQKEN